MTFFLICLGWASVILITFFAILWVSDRIIEWAEKPVEDLSCLDGDKHED